MASALVFIVFSTLIYLKISPAVDQAIPLAKEWVNEVHVIAANTAPPTLSTEVQTNNRAYVIVVPQRDGVTDEEWVQFLERKLLAVKGPQ